MHIGILTLPLHANYGGILQAWALQTILEHMGHKVVVFDIDRDIHRTPFRQSFTLAKYLFQKYLLRRNVPYYDPQKINHERREREQHTRAFIDRHIHVYMIRRLENDVKNDLDAIIVGSDQIWRYNYFRNSFGSEIENAFLRFAQNWPIRRIAYGVSFGTDQWEYSVDETRKCSMLLKKFNAVSVRERSGIEICERMLGYKNPMHVLDPTMLLTKEAYISLINDAQISHCTGNLFCYILDESEEKDILIKRISQERRLQPFVINSKFDKSDAPQSARIQPPLELWLRGFMDAEFVITDSFHGCVFSLIFDKPFIALGNKDRGQSRFDSLVSTFSLEKNLISSLHEYSPQNSYKIPTYAKQKYKEMYKKSIDFLKDSLV